MAVRLVRLNDGDIDLLKKIYQFGGYTTSLAVENYRKDCTLRGIRYILKKLADNGYLEPIQFYSGSDRDALVYRITPKTCNMLEDANPYAVKRHEDPHIIRMLVQQHFLFEVYWDIDGHNITNREDKASFLNRAGFDSDILPKKLVNGVPITLLDECIIDGLNARGTILCRQNCELLYDFNAFKGLIIAYTDKYTFKTQVQLENLINRYKNMLEAEKTRISFLVVVDRKGREDCYRKAINALMEARKRSYEIHPNYIEYHRRILHEKFGISEEELRDMPQRIKDTYSDIQDISEEDYRGMSVSDLRLNGIKAAGRAVGDIINSGISYEEKKKQVKEFFRKFYRLCAAGEIVRGEGFDIKVYRIGRQYSVL